LGRVRLFALLLCLPATAYADLTIAGPSCAELELAEIERLVEVEIGDVAAEWSERADPVVLLGCAEGTVRIEITDPVTDKSVARTIVAPPPEDAERVIALAVAQLFVTSWLELLIDGDHADSEGAQEAERIARAAIEPEPVVPPIETPPVEPPPPIEPPSPGPSITGELTIEAGARYRVTDEALGTGIGALRGQLVIDSLLVGARVALEWGRTSRTRGTIDAWLAAFGITAGWRSPPVGAFYVDVSAIVSVVYMALAGRPSGSGVAGGTTQAIAAEIGAEVVPSIRLGPVIVGLALAVGGVLFAAPGVVTGERPVDVGGLALSAALRIGLAPAFL
jgi:hypothetical protein